MKKIFCFILVVLMLAVSLPIAVLAEEVGEAIEEIGTPIASVSSLYTYSENLENEFRALPDSVGTFHLDITLSKAPENDEDVIVYYRTVDDSAVAQWGDYESVGAVDEAYVILSRSNSYKVRVTVNSTVLDNGFTSSNEKAERQTDKLVTRRFIFELTRVDGNARVKKGSTANRNELYCYLRANNYSYQTSAAVADTGAWQSNMKDAYFAKVAAEIDYRLNNDLSFSPEMAYELRSQLTDKWYSGISHIPYETFYHSTYYLNTPHFKHGGSYASDMNLSFSEDWRSYVTSGMLDIGVSLNAKLGNGYWDSDGDVTFTLYYKHEKKLKPALTLYFEGEFDDSQYFGWEHAYEYALEGLTSGGRKDHIDDNYFGYVLYDNDENVAYDTRKPADGSVSKTCDYIKNSIRDGYATELMAVNNEGTDYNDNFTSYYVKLPSNFVLGEEFYYSIVFEYEREKEIRWLENGMLSFTLMNSKAPMIAKDESGNQMVSTNISTLREGDPLRMSIRFDRPVSSYDPDENFYISADIYNDKGTCLAKGVKLKLKQLQNVKSSPLFTSYSHYAWDTLVFVADLPPGLENAKIASIRNMKIPKSTEGRGHIKSFFTNHELIENTIDNIYVDKDMRTPVATVSQKSTNSWVKSRSLDIYVNVKDNNSARFNDYATVYYQWSNSPELPKTYSSKLVFNTSKDGEIMKTIIGTGNGETYLHIKTVSSYGKTSISDALTNYYDPDDENAVYTPFGPFKFDNAPPTLLEDDIIKTGTLRERTISFVLPDDAGRSGTKDLHLYYIDANGEDKLLRKFTPDNFKGDPQTLSYTISHVDVGVGVDENGDVILDRKEVRFYWVLTDKLGNTTGKTAEFILVFDTHDYLDNEITDAGSYDISSVSGTAQFVANTQEINEQNFIYNYRPNGNKTYNNYLDTGKKIYYSFAFTLKDKAFGETDNGTYEANIYYKGEKVDEANYTVAIWNDNVRAVFFHTEMSSGRYDIQLTRIEGESTRVSRVYSVYVTDGEDDETEVKTQVESGTLLSNSVYQLSTQYPHFYYKDENGTIQKEYYNDTKQVATFSSYAKAKEYVYYKELGDIYLVCLTEATANALKSGTTGYLLAKGEDKVTPQAGQYWIRYKSSAWTPTSGDSFWVYYYYGMSDVLSEDSFSLNLLNALNEVSNRIVSYGKTVILTDTSLFLGSVMGEKMLDEYGMPYLVPGQIHNNDEFSSRTKCGNEWSTQIAFAGDKNIYKSNVFVGVQGTENYREYPIAGNFILPETSIFQYMTYDQYMAYDKGGAASWKTLDVKAGDAFINIFTSSGVYYIRELSNEGVSIYAIYVDKEAPRVNFFNTDDKGNMKEIPIDGIEIHDIRTKDLYIGSIFATEYDRLSYVAVYKVSDLSLVKIYTANELDLANVKLDDGNYYLVVADRSGNCYTITAKISSTDLECNVKETTNKHIKLTCNRRSDQIVSYEVYLNGVLLTSTYTTEQTFDKAGLYTIYVQDIYGNEFYKEHLFNRDYPTVTWKYLGSDGIYHTYDPKSTSTSGFVLTWISDNQYKISTAVKTRFSFSEGYAYEFVGTAPSYTETIGAETVVTIDAGESFTLKVYYKNHKDCFTIYSGIVDVTPPTVNVSAEIDMLRNGEYDMFDEWIANGEVSMDSIYYVFSEIVRTNVSAGGTVSSDKIKISANDANALSLIEVYLNGTLTHKQDIKTGFSEIVVSKWGDYRVVAKDTLGNVTEYTFKNGKPEGLVYFVDGAEKDLDLHGYLNFNEKHEYTKIDYGNSDFKLNITKNADIFMSVGISGGKTQIYGFSISDGQIYSLTYTISNGVIDLVVGEALINVNSEDFKPNKEYLISKTDSYEIYASIGSDKSVSIKVYASNDASKVVSVGARIEFTESYITYVSAELSKKSSDVTFKEIGTQSGSDIRVNNGFTVDESVFEDERIESIKLYYSTLNDLDVNKLDGKTNIYKSDVKYDDEGFYLMIVRNRYGNEKVYKIAISRSFGITSSVTFSDGHKIHYSKDYNEKLYSNDEITLDILGDDVTYKVTLNGANYTSYMQKKEDGITYLVFTDAGTYEVTLTDSYGNVIVRQLEINKSAYVVSGDLLTGYNEKALKRDEGYTNQKLSIDKDVYDKEGLYYLAVQYGDTLTVLFDTFSETIISTDAQELIDIIGAQGDGVYKVICRNRYGAVEIKDIHYRSTPTLKLERTTRSKSETEVYDLNTAVSMGFWSNNTLSFSTEAKTYVFTINGSVTECPRTIVFENAGDFGSFEYEITYVDEYGFEYRFKAYLVRKNIIIEVPSNITGTEINGILNTKNDISITFGENMYSTYTRNNGEEVVYRSGDVLKKDGTYRFTVMDYAGNASTLTIKKDTAVEFAFVDSISGNVIHSGSVVNTTKINFDVLNKDSSFIEKVLLNGVVQTDFSGSKFTGDGKWEIILSDQIGNKAYFSFYIVTRAQNGFAYTTPYEYRITELWYDGGDGVSVSYMNFVDHTDFTSSFNFMENGKYTVVMTSDVTGVTSTFEFTVNTNAPEVSLVGCNNGETTLNDVTFTGYKVGDRIKIFRATDTGEELLQDIEITSMSTKVPTITEGGKYRIVIESEAGVSTELTLVRKHVMNTAGSIFIMVVIGLAVVGLFTGLIYRNKSKTDD